MSQVRVFINYRRSDTRHVAGRLRDLIVARFGEESVFVDVESILPGEDYVTAIDTAVSRCMVMCVLIGESWLAVDTEGVRRVDDPADRLRLEVEAGLRHHTVVIPVLVDAATMPKTRDLPESLVPLSRHQAVRLRHDSFHSDCQRLLEVIDRIAAEPMAAPGTGSATAASAVSSDARSATPPVASTVARSDAPTGFPSAVPPAESVHVAVAGGGPGEPAAETAVRRAARWSTVAVLLLAVLCLLGLQASAGDVVLASRPDLPTEGPWGSLVWLMPGVLVAVASWLVGARRSPGTALGLVAAGWLWVMTTVVLVKDRDASAPTSAHVLVLLLLTAALVGIAVAEPSIRVVGGNRVGPAVPAAFLLVAAIALRVLSYWIAGRVTGTSTDSFDVSGTSATAGFWLALLLPLLVCLPAVVLRLSRALAQALVTVAILQIVYPVLLRAMMFSGATEHDTAAAVLVDDVVFLTGCVCMLLSVRTGQHRSARALGPTDAQRY